MANKRGRPRNPEGESTTQVKLADDLVDKIRWIVKAKRIKDKGYTANELVEPMIRAQIETEFKRNEAKINILKEAEKSAAEIEDEE